MGVCITIHWQASGQLMQKLNVCIVLQKKFSVWESFSEYFFVKLHYFYILIILNIFSNIQVWGMWAIILLSLPFLKPSINAHHCQKQSDYLGEIFSAQKRS